MSLTPRFQFPGIDPATVKSASYALGHGITPGVITVEVPAGTPLPQREGTAVFSYGATEIRVVGCRVDVGNCRRGQGVSWVFSILDGRWRWEYGGPGRNGFVTGHYNLRRPDGVLRPETERDPQSLAQALLRMMRVERSDVSALPSALRPELHWSWATPAEALQGLADAVGCRVVYRPDGFVGLYPAGQGAELPDLPLVNDSFSLDTGAVPSNIVVVGRPALFQARWKTRPVGRDVDGEVKPIEQLSYQPAGGWFYETPGMFQGVDASDDEDAKDDPRRLALQTVWRWYQITEMVGGPLLPGAGSQATINSYRECLPLQDGLVDVLQADAKGTLQQKPPVVRGTFLDEQFTYAEVEDGIFRGDFSILRELGVVQFAQPVYRIDSGAIVQADLTLEIAFEWRPTADEPWRPTWTFPVQPRPDVGDKVLHREELAYNARWEYRGGYRAGQRNNRQADELDQQARHAAALWLQSLQAVQAADRTYAGLVEINPDGAISQVTWQIGGGQPCVTRASRNSEHDTDLFPPYQRRWQNQQLRAIIDQSARQRAGKARG